MTQAHYSYVVSTQDVSFNKDMIQLAIFEQLKRIADSLELYNERNEPVVIQCSAGSNLDDL